MLGGLFSGKLLATEVKLEFVQRDVGCHSLKGFMIPAAITYSAILGLVMGRGVLSVRGSDRVAAITANFQTAASIGSLVSISSSNIP